MDGSGPIGRSSVSRRLSLALWAFRTGYRAGGPWIAVFAIFALVSTAEKLLLPTPGRPRNEETTKNGPGSFFLARLWRGGCLVKRGRATTTLSATQTGGRRTRGIMGGPSGTPRAESPCRDIGRPYGLSAQRVRPAGDTLGGRGHAHTGELGSSGGLGLCRWASTGLGHNEAENWGMARRRVLLTMDVIR